MAFPRISRARARVQGGGGTSSLFSRLFTTGLTFGVTLGYVSYRYQQLKSNSEIVLALDLSRPPPEVADGGPLSFKREHTHYEVLRVLQHASRDPRIKGIVANVTPSGAQWSMAQAQEVRQAIEQFRATKKFAFCFASSFGELSESATPYYLATAFDRILMQPCGDVNVAGIASQNPFLGGFFERFGITPQFAQRKEYKTAVNMFTQKDFTDAHRESVVSLLTSMLDQLCTAICRDRHIAPSTLTQALDAAPLSSQQAKDFGLVDDFVYENALPRVLKDHVLQSSPGPTLGVLGGETTAGAAAPANSAASLGRDPKILRFNAYAQEVLARQATSDKISAALGAPKIALLYGVGQVSTQPGSYGNPGFHSSTLAKAIQRAAQDESVKAIVFRIDSPGGSYVAADTVYQALIDAKAKGKKIIVSMGSLAASGGYFAAAPADYIFANPATLTGSIGVFGGKFALRDLLRDKLGVSFGTIRVGGQNAGMNSLVDPWSPSQLANIESTMDRIYDDFVQKVARGRRRPVDHIERVAKGRVWTGVQALENGLVDELGTLNDAIAKARSMLPIDLQRNAIVQVIPRKKSLLSMLSEASRRSDADKDEDPLFASNTPSSSASSFSPTASLAALAADQLAHSAQHHFTRVAQDALFGAAHSLLGLSMSPPHTPLSTLFPAPAHATSLLAPLHSSSSSPSSSSSSSSSPSSLFSY